jgi:8-oxo-dGTP pyrophosphatase MutT (NUDIX family)
MKKETSAGGIVIVGNALLLLRKYNGDWVLPKGRVEAGEEVSRAALREVLEESGVKAEIVKYIGEITYPLNSHRKDKESCMKTVHWFLMKARNMDCKHQREEGFVEAKYIHISRATEIAHYNDEKRMIELARAEYQKGSAETLKSDGDLSQSC